MIFSDQKSFGSWWMIFFGFLTLVNYEHFQGFRWTAFLSLVTILALLSAIRFRKTSNPSRAFYCWGLCLWSLLAVTFLSFALFLFSRIAGRLPSLVLAIFLTSIVFFFVRQSLRCEQGSTKINTRALSWVVGSGACFSGVLKFYISEEALMFTVALAIDVLMTFTMLCGAALWLKKLKRLKPSDTS